MLSDERSSVLDHHWPTVRQPEHRLEPPNRMLPAPADTIRPAEAETVVGLGDIWRIALRRRGLVIGTTLAFALTALLYAYLATPLYSATAQLLIDPRDRQVLNRDLNASVVAPDGGITVVESQVKVIESDSVLLRALAIAGLENDPEFTNAAPGFVSHILERLFPPAERVVNAKSIALRKLRRRLAVKRADKVFVVDIIVTLSDPDKAARVVNAIAKAYLADQTDARADAARRASGELSNRLDSLRADVNAAETKLEAFKAKHGLIASSGLLVGEQQLTDINTRLTAAQNRVAETRSKLQDVRNARGHVADASNLPEAIQSLTVERLRAQYAELISKEGDMRTSLGQRHPAMLAVQAQKADVRRLIDAELDRIVKASEVEYQRAVNAVRLLSERLDTLRAESVQTNRDTVQLRELERAAAASRSVYDTFLTRSREIAEQANIDPTNARIISLGLPPEDRSWPLRGLIGLAGLAVGLSLGIGLAMVREYIRPTVLSRRQLEWLLRAPVLAVLARKSLLRKTADACREAAVPLDSLHGFETRSPHIGGLSVVLTSADRDAAERRALVELLAKAAVERGERVLLVETEVDGSEPGTAGLLEVLRGEVSLQAATITDPATGARCLRIGNGQKPVRDAFDPENVEVFLTYVRQRFDLVIADGGDLSRNLRVGNLVRLADHLLVGARVGQTTQSDIVALRRVAAAMGQAVFGALLIDEAVRAR